MRDRGKFIVFEGPNGSGKSTIIERISGPVKEVAFPSPQNPLGNLLSTWLLEGPSTVSDPTWIATAVAEMLLIQEKVIEPALSERTNVICDRWFYSTSIYHPPLRMFDPCFAKLRRPDLLVICNADTDTLRERVEKRHPDRRQVVRDSTLASTQRGYRKLITDTQNVLRIDTGESEGEIAECVAQVRERIEDLE